MIRTWVGNRHVALIPVIDTRIDSTPPQDWGDQIQQRLFYDPEPSTGLDRSLQQYLRILSSGRASITAEVFPVVESPNDDTVGAGLSSVSDGSRFDAAVIVLPHSDGDHRRGFAWMDVPPNNGFTNFCRVSMFSDRALSNRDGGILGLWAHEVIHVATNFPDLYNISENLGPFDLMATGNQTGTHPTIYTKHALGWADNSSIKQHPIGANRTYNLHVASLPHPPPPWRSSAIRIATATGGNYFMVEARTRVDPYEDNTVVSMGLPSEGVIVYEVSNSTDPILRTDTALAAGNSFIDEESQIEINVVEAEVGGFVVQVKSEVRADCNGLREDIDRLTRLLDAEDDPILRQRINSQLQRARRQYQMAGCPTSIF